MGAGKADGGVTPPCPCQAIEDGLLAAHHIRRCRIALGNAGKNADVTACPVDPHRAVGNRGQIAGRVEIGRLAPALGGSGHAADQHRRIRRHRHCGQAAVEFRFEPVPVKPSHPLFGAVFGLDAATSVHRPQAKVAGAPVGQNDVGRAAAGHLRSQAGSRPTS